MKVEIRLLGGFEILRDGEPGPPPASRSARSLLGYLVVTRDRLHTRDRLAGVFWPDEPESAGRRKLTQAIWQIGRPFGGPEAIGVITPGDQVGFVRLPDVGVDVDEFEWALARAAESDTPAGERALLEEASAMYRGDLLDGFYDEWIDAEREHLRRRRADALDRIVDLALRASDYDGALATAQLRLEHDPLEEAAHRRVMQILALLGRHDEALRHYERCRKILSDDLGVEPSVRTERLRREIVADRDSAPLRLPGLGIGTAAPLVGRDAEMAAVARRLDAVPAGRGGVVLIEGEPGSGKTRMLEELVRSARWRGIDVLAANAGTAGLRPYAVLSEALTSGLTPIRFRQLANSLDPVWRATVAPMVPELSSGPGVSPPLPEADERQRTREAFVRSFVALPSLNPVALLIDDAHLADRESLAVLARLCERAPALPLLIVLAYRHADARDRREAWELVQAVESQAATDLLGLQPLSPAQTEHLVGALLSGRRVPPEVSDHIHRSTGGIPLLVVEMSRAIDERTGSSHLPGSVREHLVARVHEAGDVAEIVLRCLALEPAGLLAAEAAEAAAHPDALGALELSVAAGLAIERSDRYHVAHELLGRTLLEHTHPDDFSDLHCRIADAIERYRPGEAGLLAAHLESAGLPARAARYQQAAAGEAVAAHALDDAADLLAAALANLTGAGEGPEARFEVAAALEPLLDTLGDRDRQDAAIDVLEETAGPERRADTLRRRARWLLHEDRIADAERCALDGLDTARKTGDSRSELALLTTLATLASLSGRAADGVAWLEETLRNPKAGVADVADAHRALGKNLVDLQRFDEAEHHLHAALARYGELNDTRGQCDTLGALGALRLERGETDAARSVLERAVSAAATIGYRRGEAAYRTNLAIVHTMQQHIGAALEEFTRAREIYEVLGSRRGLAMALNNEAWLRVATLGDACGARELAEHALALCRMVGDQRGIAQALATIAAVEDAQGDRTSLETLREGIRLAEAAQDRWISAQLQLQEAEVLTMRSAFADAAIAAERAEREAASAALPDLESAARIWQVLIATRSGNTGTAKALIDQVRPSASWHLHLYWLAVAEVERAASNWREADSAIECAHTELQRMLQDVPQPLREQALAVVPIYSSIRGQFHDRQPRIAQALVPSAETPRGKAPSPEQWIWVDWESWLPSDDMLGPIQARRNRLARFLDACDRHGARPTIPYMAAALETSAATVRRDLKILRTSTR